MELLGRPRRTRITSILPRVPSVALLLTVWGMRRPPTSLGLMAGTGVIHFVHRWTVHRRPFRNFTTAAFHYSIHTWRPLLLQLHTWRPLLLQLFRLHSTFCACHCHVYCIFGENLQQAAEQETELKEGQQTWGVHSKLMP
jgi:hypothetical protein